MKEHFNNQDVSYRPICFYRQNWTQVHCRQQKQFDPHRLNEMIELLAANEFALYAAHIQAYLWAATRSHQPNMAQGLPASKEATEIESLVTSFGSKASRQVSRQIYGFMDIWKLAASRQVSKAKEGILQV